MRPRIVYELDGQRVVFPLDGDVATIGRAPTNDIVIGRQYVSRHHARIEKAQDAWRVVDLGSKCGTRINNLDGIDKPLIHGDRIFLQDFCLTFEDPLARPADSRNSRPDSLGVSLTAASADLGLQTIIQTAVDFSELASFSPDVQRLQQLLTIVTRTSEAILASEGLQDTFHKVLGLVFEHLPVQRGCIMLWDDEQQDLVPHCVRNRSSSADLEIQFSRTIAEQVYREKVSVLTTDAQTDGRFAEGASIIRLGIRSAMAAPLWNGNNVNGLIYVDTTLQTQAFDKFDLDLLSALGNHLAVAIEQSRLQEDIMRQQLVRRRLERYHSAAVIERITVGRDGSDDAMMADEREATVLFADVVSFTKRCENMEPRAIAELLNRYFSEMTEVIFHHEGTLDKFIGDCLMAVFGAPLKTDDHARRAAAAALEMRQALWRLNEPLPPEERLHFRVGIHSGRVVAGDIGSVRRRDYTVLGATVNLAARLESVVAGPDQIIISEATRAALGAPYLTRPAGEHELKGIRHRVQCHELLDPPKGQPTKM